MEKKSLNRKLRSNDSAIDNYSPVESNSKEEIKNNEKLIKNLQEKLKRAQNNTYSEIERYKFKLIMERHEREKEQADNSAMIKELQRLIADERRGKEQLEQRIKEMKNQMPNKSQNKILQAELEMANKKLRQIQVAAKETSSFVTFQTEMDAKNALELERKKAAEAEQKAKALEMAHEARVTGLEARLAELSDTVGTYDRAIQKLKDQLAKLQQNTCDNYIDEIPESIMNEIKRLYSQLLEMNDKKDNSINIKEFLKSLDHQNTNFDAEKSDYKQKYELLLQEFEDYKQKMNGKLMNAEKLNKIENKQSDTNKHLEERIRELIKQVKQKENEIEMMSEQQSQLFQEEKMKYERLVIQKDNEYRGKLGKLEQQLLRQRERSFAVVEEKEEEIKMLKSSFRALLMKNNNDSSSHSEKSLIVQQKNSQAATSLLAMDSPPLIHYAQELSRREIEMAALRKQNTELDNILRENQKDLLAMTQSHANEIKNLKAQIVRLEACKSREGANLEYLKNVFINYLSSNKLSNKRHMLNAISTILKFTPDELDKIHKIK